MFANEFLPIYDISDSVAVVVDADAATTWAALMSVDLIDVGHRKPLVGILSAVRMVPELLSGLVRGKLPPRPPKQLRLRDTAGPSAEGGTWILLGERPGETLALGLVGKFWRPVISYAAVDRERFRDFAEAGYAKTVYELSAHELPDGRTLLIGLMRTATTDEHARRMFGRYWTLGVGSGAHVLVRGVLERAREVAEYAPRPADRSDPSTERAVAA